MNPRDVWFVGLLALAYLYFDSTAPERRASAGAKVTPLPVPQRAPVGPMPVCPRDDAHPVSLRRDGVKWCLACDEAFYPVALAI